MARLINEIKAVLVEQQCKKFNFNHVNHNGVLLIYESQKQYAGKNFIRFFHGSKDSPDYFHTSECEVIYDGDFILVKTKDGNFFKFKQLE